MARQQALSCQAAKRLICNVWCMGLLLVASFGLAAAAEPFGLEDPAAVVGSYGDAIAGQYGDFDDAIAGQYGQYDDAISGAYGMHSPGSYGGYAHEAVTQEPDYSFMRNLLQAFGEQEAGFPTQREIQTRLAMRAQQQQQQVQAAMASNGAADPTGSGSNTEPSVSTASSSSSSSRPARPAADTTNSDNSATDSPSSSSSSDAKNVVAVPRGPRRNVNRNGGAPSGSSSSSSTTTTTTVPGDDQVLADDASSSSSEAPAAPSEIITGMPAKTQGGSSSSSTTATTLPAANSKPTFTNTPRAAGARNTGAPLVARGAATPKHSGPAKPHNSAASASTSSQGSAAAIEQPAAQVPAAVTQEPVAGEPAAATDTKPSTPAAAADANRQGTTDTEAPAQPAADTVEVPTQAEDTVPAAEGNDTPAEPPAASPSDAPATTDDSTAAAATAEAPREPATKTPEEPAAATDSTDSTATAKTPEDPAAAAGSSQSTPDAQADTKDTTAEQPAAATTPATTKTPEEPAAASEVITKAPSADAATPDTPTADNSNPQPASGFTNTPIVRSRGAFSNTPSISIPAAAVHVSEPAHVSEPVSVISTPAAEDTNTGRSDRNNRDDDVISVPVTNTQDDSNSGTSDDLDTIVPEELPATKSWDTLTWKSWEEWYAHNFAKGAAAGPTAAAGPGGYAQSIVAGYGSYGGVEDFIHGAYGSYGAEGAYFDFRSGLSYAPNGRDPSHIGADADSAVSPASDDDTAEPGTYVQDDTLPSEIPSSTANDASNQEAVDASQQLHVASQPALGGVSRGRGLSLTLTPLAESAAALWNGKPPVQPAMAGQQRSASGPVRKLLSKAFTFSRRMHMSRAAAAEAAGWAAARQ